MGIELLIRLVQIMLELCHLTSSKFFIYVALNSSDICATDAQKTHLQAPSLEKYYIICGPEFGINKGKKVLMIKAVCGKKSAERDYWLHLQSCTTFLGFTLCKINPDF